MNAVDAMEEQVLEAQVTSMFSRIFGDTKRTHDDIERDIRRDQYEMAKVLRGRMQLESCQEEPQSPGPSSHLGGSSSSLIVYMAKTLASFEFNDEQPERTPYSELHGLRCLVRASTNMAQGKYDDNKSFRDLRLTSSRDVMREVQLANRYAQCKAVTALDDTQVLPHSVSCAWSVLALCCDVLGSDAIASLPWNRSLQHVARSATQSYAFLPRLPAPCVAMDKYLAWIILAVRSMSSGGVACSPLEDYVLSHGVNRIPDAHNSSGDGDKHTISLTRKPALLNDGSSAKTNVVVVVSGQVFAIDVTTSQGTVFPLADLSRVLSMVFAAAARGNMRGGFVKCTALSTDDLVDISPDDSVVAKGAYRELRQEIAQIKSHARLVELLDNALFAVSFDDTLSRDEMLQQREVGTPMGSQKISYPFFNRWLTTVVNIAVDREGQITLQLPTCIAGSTSSGRRPLLDRMSKYLLHRIRMFDGLQCETVPQGPLLSTLSRCIWAAGIVFKTISATPGSCILCLVPEQLAMYCTELMKVIPDEEEREALSTASLAFRRMVYLTDSLREEEAVSQLSLFFEEARVSFRVVPHPVIQAPLQAPSVSAQHTRLLVTCLINPFVKLSFRAQSANVQHIDVYCPTDALLSAMSLTPPGMLKLSVLEKLNLFGDPLIEECSIESIDLFSSLPSKEQRKQTILAAGKVGYHIAHQNEALAAVEDRAKKQYQRLLYTQDILLSKYDPWVSKRLLCSEGEDGPTTAFSEIVSMESKSLFQMSRNLSRYCLEQFPSLEDEAIDVRCAQPDCVLRSICTLAIQLAIAHVYLPVQLSDVGARDISNVLMHDWNVNGEVELIAGESIALDSFLQLYYDFTSPGLCGAPKTAKMSTHEATKLYAATLLQLICQHHYEPITAAHHIKGIGNIQRPSHGENKLPVALDVNRYLATATQHRVKRVLSWCVTADLLDCAARCGPVLAGEVPCSLSSLNTQPAAAARSPLLSVFHVETESLELNTGDNAPALLRQLRNQRVHYARHTNSAALDEYGKTRPSSAIQLHVVRTTSTRFIDHTISEMMLVDIRGVWASDAIAKNVLDVFKRCFCDIVEMWSKPASD